MLFVLWAPIIFQLLVPLALLAWLGYGRPSSRISWVVRVLLAGLYLIAIGIGGLWLILPWYLPVIYGAVLLFAIAHSFRRVRSLPATPPGWPGVAALVLTSLEIGRASCRGRA